VVWVGAEGDMLSWSRIEKTMETRGFSRETTEILERLLLWCNEAAQLQKPERFQVPEAPLGRLLPDQRINVDSGYSQSFSGIS